MSACVRRCRETACVRACVDGWMQGDSVDACVDVCMHVRAWMSACVCVRGGVRAYAEAVAW